MSFSKWYRTLPSPTHKEMRNEVCRKCCVSKSVFYDWLGGRTKIPYACKTIINNIANSKIFEI